MNKTKQKAINEWHYRPQTEHIIRKWSYMMMFLNCSIYYTKKTQSLDFPVSLISIFYLKKYRKLKL